MLGAGKTSENGQRSYWESKIPRGSDRRLRYRVTDTWGRYRLGHLSVILSSQGRDGLMYSQASMSTKRPCSYSITVSKQVVP